jgi:hypothetical protein
VRAESSAGLGCAKAGRRISATMGFTMGLDVDEHRREAIEKLHDIAKT